MSDRDQRTEKATPQRIRKAREEGRFPASREFVAGTQFAVFTAMLVTLAHHWWPRAQEMTRDLLMAAFRWQDAQNLRNVLLQGAFWKFSLPFVLAGLVVFLAGFGAQLATTGFGFAASSLAPDPKRFNPGQKIRNLWSQSRRSALEAAILLICVAGVGYWLSGQFLDDEFTMVRMSLRQAVAQQSRLIGGLLVQAALFLTVWGTIDLVRARHRYAKELRMTRQEVREEHRQNEGSPEIKLRIRRLRRELLRRRMIAQVAEATAVVTNPTHYAVALKYELGALGAPKVVAKGKNYLAQRIRQRAIEHQVPVVENPPLARALYSSVDVGAEIPSHLYRAVAEVLAYVFRVLDRGSSRSNGGRI